MIGSDLMKETEFHLQELNKFKESYETQTEYIRDLEDKNRHLQSEYEQLKDDFLDMPGFEEYDDVDLESLKKSY